MELQEYITMRSCEDSHWWYVGLHALVSRSVQEALPNEGQARVLDAGCGTGGNMTVLSRTLGNLNLTGIDLHPFAVRCTKERKAGDVARARVETLPFPSGVFDLVISLGVLYMKGIEEEKAIEEMRRVLKPGGVLLLDLGAFEFLRGAHDLAMHTERRYTKKKVRRLLSTAGFAIEKLFYWNATLFPCLVFWRLLSRLLGNRKAPHSDLVVLPVFINRALTRLILWEMRWVARISCPFGSSIFSIARKGEGG